MWIGSPYPLFSTKQVAAMLNMKYGTLRAYMCLHPDFRPCHRERVGYLWTESEVFALDIFRARRHLWIKAALHRRAAQAARETNKTAAEPPMQQGSQQELTKRSQIDPLVHWQELIRREQAEEMRREEEEELQEYQPPATVRVTIC